MIEPGTPLISDKERQKQQVIDSQPSPSTVPSKTVNTDQADKKGDNMNKQDKSNEQTNPTNKEAAMSEYKESIDKMEKANSPVYGVDNEDDLDSLETEYDEDRADDLDDLDVVEGPEAEPVVLPTLASLAGDRTTKIVVRPKILFTISYTDTELKSMSRAIRSVNIEDEYYSFESVLRTGKGLKKNPYGALRQPLTEFLAYISSLTRDGDLNLIGSPSDAADIVGEISNAILAQASTLLYAPYADANGTPQIRVPMPRESVDGQIDMDAEVKYTNIDIRSIYDMTFWDTATQLEDGSFELGMTFNLNMQIPLMHTNPDKPKVLGSLFKVLKLLSERTDGVECYFGLALDAESLADAEVRGLLDLVLTDELYNPIEDSVIVLTDGYIEKAIQTGADPMGLLPAALTRTEIKDVLFNQGGSLLALSTIPLNAELEDEDDE